jgi:hypothetical protein
MPSNKKSFESKDMTKKPNLLPPLFHLGTTNYRKFLKPGLEMLSTQACKRK